MMVKLVEQRAYKPSHPDFEELDRVCRLSKNLYNSTLYAARQAFFETGFLRDYYDLNKEFADTDQRDYRALPAKVAKYTQKLVHQSIVSHLGLMKLWGKGELEDRPGLPGYIKKNGRQVLTYHSQALSFKKKGFVRLSGTSVYISTERGDIKFVRVVPSKVNLNITVEIGYEQESMEQKQNGKLAAIDLGVNNLATLVFTDRAPIIYNGRPLKSINQYYNKRLAALKAKQDQSSSKRKTTNRIRRLHAKRNNKIKDYMHKASREIANQLAFSGISTLIVGYNKGWKQDVNFKKSDNQNFVQIPFLRFLNMLRYKCALIGIKVEDIQEAYTSKCSFLDDEPLCGKKRYMGYRQKRGLYKSYSGRRINADVNGGMNILKKYCQEKEAWKAGLHRDCVEACSAPSVFTVKYKHVS